MADAHHHPAGTIVKYGPAGGTATISITDVQEAMPPETKYGDSNDTALLSAGAIEENSPGWGKNSHATIKCYLMEVQTVALQTISAARKNVPWNITYAPVGSSTVGFKVDWLGGVSVKINGAVQSSDDKISVDLDVSCSGAITMTIGNPTP